MTTATEITTRTAENFRELARVNTGTHMLDSGGTNGRHWQQPAINERAPKVTASVWDGKIEYLSVNTALHLDEILYIDRVATEAFHDWCDEVDPGKRQSPLALMEKYAETMMPDAAVTSDNSYNWDSPYDQVFQFVAASYSDWMYDEDALLLIQMHNGADVRGGYTEAVIAKPWSSFGDGMVEILMPDSEFRPYCNECYADAESISGGLPEDWTSKVSDDEKTATVVCPNGHDTAEYPVN